MKDSERTSRRPDVERSESEDARELRRVVKPRRAVSLELRPVVAKLRLSFVDEDDVVGRSKRVGPIVQIEVDGRELGEVGAVVSHGDVRRQRANRRLRG